MKRSPRYSAASTIRGVGADGAQSRHAYFQSALAHVLNGKARGDCVRALEEENHIGIVRHELFNPWIVVPAENFLEFLVDLLDDSH